VAKQFFLLQRGFFRFTAEFSTVFPVFVDNPMEKPHSGGCRSETQNPRLVKARV
jgi:hypothetical protein